MISQVSIFINDLFLSVVMILLTTVTHAYGLDKTMRFLQGRMQKVEQGLAPRRHVHKMAMGVTSILGIFALVTFHIWVWAALYMWLDIKEFKTLEDAVYFSTVTFTTLGYGDIVLHGQWRVLSGIEAANGIILLGWSTAFLFEVMQLLYPRRAFNRMP